MIQECFHHEENGECTRGADYITYLSRSYDMADDIYDNLQTQSKFYFGSKKIYKTPSGSKTRNLLGL